MGRDFPVCIPSAILRAKVPCVIIYGVFHVFLRVQLGVVRWPYLTCPITTATAWSPAGISVHWFGGYRSEDNDADDVFWNLLLRSVNQHVLEPLHLPDFLSIHLLFWEGWSPGLSLHQLLREQALVIMAQMMDHVLMWSLSFVLRKLSRWLSSDLYRCCEVAMHVEETHRNTSNPHICCLNFVPCKFEPQFKSYRVIVMKSRSPASRNFLSDSWFDSWVGQMRQKQQAASTNSLHREHDELSGTSQKHFRYKMLEFSPQRV